MNEHVGLTAGPLEAYVRHLAGSDKDSYFALLTF
jgi:hypothetical protein